MRMRLPEKEWDPKAKFLDFALFRQRIFAIYCLGTFFVVWVYLMLPIPYSRYGDD